jgi:phosphate transport system protein
MIIHQLDIMMVHLNTELQILKSNIIEMWNLVISQFAKTNKAIHTADCDLIIDIKVNEKLVDAFELKINLDCENILALFNPLANDLRFVLAVLKINYNLERIGDYAHGIAKLVEETPFSKEGLKETGVKDMFLVATGMLTDALESFEKEDLHKLQEIFNKDKKLDKVNKNASRIIAGLIEKKPKDIQSLLNLLSVIRKLERVGDQTKNIGEEIVFYIEAKILRHNKKKKV